MTKKAHFVVLAFSMLVSAGAAATSIDGMYTPRGNQHEYMKGGMNAPLGVGEVPTYDVPIFVRGGFNGWGATDEMVYQGNGIYEAIIDLDAGEWQFKIASDDWSTVDLGAIFANAVTLGELIGIGLAPGEEGNLSLDITVAGTYSFLLDTVTQPGRTLNLPFLTVSLLSPLPVPAPGTLALIGLGLIVFVARRGRRRT